MISVQSLRVEFGPRVLFNDLSFSVQPRERIAFAGHNGAGKSTLMKCIAEIIPPSGGQISKPKGTKIGYLPQEGIHVKGRTLWKETESAFGEIMALKEKVDRLSDQLVKLDPRSSPYGELLEEIGELELKLYANDPALMKPKIESVLKGLGFQEKDFKRDCSEFSGGWQMRIAMAKLFLQQPEVLLLDEPTNHLDMQSQGVLQRALLDYPGSVMIVSHNRDFLDELVTKTLEFRPGEEPRLFHGNIAYYLDKKGSVGVSPTVKSPPATTADAEVKKETPKRESTPGVNRKEQRRLDAMAREAKTKVLAPLEKELESLEAKIAEQEAAQTTLTTALSSEEISGNPEKLRQTTNAVEKITTALDLAYTRWSSLTEEIEKVKEKHNLE